MDLQSELRYEEIRQEVIEGRPGRAPGLAILLREGVTAWLQALASWARRVPCPSRQVVPSGAQIPSDTKDELVRILARMAVHLGATQES